MGAGAGVSAAQLAAALAAHHSVEYAHLDRLVDTQRGHSRALRQGGARLYAPAVNDPAWPAQWDKRAIGLTPRPDVEALGPGGAPCDQNPKPYQIMCQGQAGAVGQARHRADAAARRGGARAWRYALSSHPVTRQLGAGQAQQGKRGKGFTPRPGVGRSGLAIHSYACTCSQPVMAADTL